MSIRVECAWCGERTEVAYDAPIRPRVCERCGGETVYEKRYGLFGERGTASTPERAIAGLLDIVRELRSEVRSLQDQVWSLGHGGADPYD